MLYIFDLDGTLLNTIADLGISTNYALERCGFPTHPIEAYKMFVGSGINNLFLRALPENAKNADNVQNVRKEFLSFYNEHNADFTIPYPGVVELLYILQRMEHKIAIASNKYQEATQKLIECYFPEINFAAVMGQCESRPIKPNPQIVYDIMAAANVEKKDVIYIGDSGIDMQTAKNAGVKSIGVTWGFRPKAELEQEQPDFLADTVEDILKIKL